MIIFDWGPLCQSCIFFDRNRCLRVLCRVIFFKTLMFFAVCGSHSVSNSRKLCCSEGGGMGGGLRVLVSLTVAMPLSY